MELVSTLSEPIIPVSTSHSAIITQCTKDQLLVNLEHYFAMIHGHSHFRQYLIQLLSPDISTSQLALFAHCSPSLISQAKHIQHNEITEQKYANNITRQKISQYELDLIESFADLYAPVKSGTHIHHCYDTYDQFYIKYVAFIMHHNDTYNTNIQPLCQKTFIQHLHNSISFPIRHVKTYYGQYDCKTCIKLRSLTSLGDTHTEEFKQCLEHSIMRQHQRTVYHNIHDNLSPNSLLLVIDFTTVTLTPNISTKNTDKQVQTFVIIFITRDSERNYTRPMFLLCVHIRRLILMIFSLFAILFIIYFIIIYII